MGDWLEVYPWLHASMADRGHGDLHGLSFVLLAHALKTLPIGTAYAVWTGIGTVETALLGIILFAEPLETVRLGCVLLIVIGITGLRLLE